MNRERAEPASFASIVDRMAHLLQEQQAQTPTVEQPGQAANKRYFNAATAGNEYHHMLQRAGRGAQVFTKEITGHPQNETTGHS